METWIRRKNYESDEDYILRIYQRKLNGELELSNQELGELMNSELGYDYDESKYRKDAQVVLVRYWDAISEMFADQEKLLLELKAEKEKMLRERRKLRDERNVIRRNRRDESRVEAMMEEFKFVSDELRADYPFHLPKVKARKHQGKDAVLLLSDIHYGAIFENHFDKYNMEIADELINKLADKVINKANMLNIENILIISAGDFVENALHISARIDSNGSVVEQILRVSEAVVAFISKLVDNDINIKYASSLGNHDRRASRYVENIEKDSFYKIIDWHIQNSLKDETERFEMANHQNFDETIGYVEFAGKKIQFVHGHLDNPKSVFTKLVGMTGIIPDRIYMGHYHEKFEMNNFGTKILVNGSFKGVDDYVKNKRLAGARNKRKQLMEVFDGEDSMIIDLNL